MKVKFNLPEIKQTISEIHNRFIEDKNFVSAKVEADKELKLARVLSKINLIAKTFVDVGIIDEFAEQKPSNSLGVDPSVSCFVLRKKGFSNSIYIMTDGTHVVIKDSSFMIDFGYFSSYSQRFIIQEDVDESDWVVFSKSLLDHIHACIYNRERVNRISIFGTG